MVPFSLKVVWLVFALLGIPATWLSFIPFASAIGTYWASVLYCLAVTLLEIIFGLGMIWKMTPSKMPYGFCVTQTVVMALSFYVLTGVCGCFTWASYLTVFKPYRSIQASASALLWRRAYFLFVIVFPLLACTAHLVALLKTHSVRRTDDMHCDNTSPLWPRLLGYAGAPILLFTPCFILSILTGFRILDMRARLRQFRSQNDNQGQLNCNRGPRMPTPRGSFGSPMSVISDKLPPQSLGDQPGMRLNVQLDRSFSSRTSLPFTRETIETESSSIQLLPIELPALSPLIIPSAHPFPPSPIPSNNSVPSLAMGRSKTPSPIIFASTSISRPNCHQAQSNASGESSHSSARDPHSNHSDERPTSPASPSRAPISLEVGEKMPGFHLPTRSPTNSLRPSLELSPEYVRARLEEDRAAGNIMASVIYTEPVLERLPEVDEAERASVMRSEHKFVNEPKATVSVGQETVPPPLKPIRKYYRAAPRPSIGRPPGLDPTIWRMVLFQLTFFFILILASLSTFIDLARGSKAPTPFGTQQIAILLVAWCPVIIFGHLPRGRNPILSPHYP